MKAYITLGYFDITLNVYKSKALLWLLFYVSPIIDAFTGFLVLNHIVGEGGAGTPSQLFRFIALLCMLLYLSDKKSFFLVVGVIGYELLLDYINLVQGGSLLGFILGVLYAYKILYALLVFMVLRKICRTVPTIVILRTIVQGTFLYAFILLASILIGIDHATYISGNFGSKGLFSSGNGLSIYLGVGSILSFYFYRITMRVRDLLIFLVILIASVCVGTKASILFLIINLCLVFYYLPRKEKVLGILILTLLVSLYSEVILLLFATVFDVIVFRYEHSDSLVSFLASNRDNYIIEAFKEYNTEGWAVLRVLIGAGIFVSFRDYGQPSLIYDSLENDFFDLFFAFGLFGLVLYLAVVFSGFFLAVKRRNLILFLAWSGIIFYSVIAGHVVFNGMSNTMLAVVYFFLLSKRRAFE